MKKETCLQLLQLLKRNDLDFKHIYITTNELLNLEEELVQEILKMSNASQIKNFFLLYSNWMNISTLANNIDLQKKVINIMLQCSSDLQLNYIVKLLCDENVIKAGIALEGAIILSSSNNHNIEFIYAVLCNEKCIKAGIALEGAKIISESKTYNQARFAKFVLCDENSINASIAIEGAKLINKSNKDFQPLYQNLVLRDENAINKGVALTGAEYILRASEEYQAQNVNYVFRNLNALNANLEKKGSNIILSVANGLVHSQNMRDVICSPYAIESDSAIKGAKMIAMTDCEYKSTYMRDVLCSKVANKYESAITSAKIIGNAKDQLHAMYQKMILCNENAVSNFVAIKTAYIINQLDEEYQLDYIKNAVNTNLNILKNSGSTIVKSIPKPTIDIKTIKIEDAIKLLEEDTEKRLDNIDSESVKEYIKVIKK